MIARLAYRNLVRNRWRTVMTIGGVAIGVAILIWLNGYLMGFHDEMIRGATASDLGQVQIATHEWVDTPSARYTFESGPVLESLKGVDGVDAASERAIIFGLVGHEDRSVVARIVGVSPNREAATTVVTTGLKAGRWLDETAPDYPAARETVLGEKFAQQLSVGVGDELVAFFEAADGSLGNELLEVVGVVSTGSTAIDRQTAFLHLEDLQRAGAMEGQVHQIALKLSNPNHAESKVSEIQAAISTDELAVRSWEEILPEIKTMVDMMQNSDIVLYILVYILVAFGLFNAQRMSALERRREFAVMMALGVSPWRLFWTVLVETVLIGAAGALLGAIVGTLATWYFVVFGLDLAAFNTSGDVNFEMMGISFSQTLYFSLGIEHVMRPILVLVPFAVLCGLWPALQAARINITTALSGRN